MVWRHGVKSVKIQKTTIGRFTLVAWAVFMSCGVHERSVGSTANADAGPFPEAPSGVTSLIPSARCAPGDLLFEPRALGEAGNEVIGTIRHDPATDDIYFSTSSELYVLRAGSTEPTLVAGGAAGGSGAFWIEGDEILLPSWRPVAPARAEVAVLTSISREGGEPRVRVRTSLEKNEGTPSEEGRVQVLGERVFWIGQRTAPAVDADPSEAADQTMYVVQTTSWRNPSKPRELYRSHRRLKHLMVAGGYVFVNEMAADGPDHDSGMQRIIDPATGTALPEGVQSRFGGVVLTGDSDSLLVSRFDYDDTSNFGTWHMRPDGSHATRLDDVLLLSIGAVPAASRNHEWMIVSLVTGENRLGVHTYSNARGQQLLGCFDEADATPALDVANERALVGIFRDGKNSIMSFPHAVDRT